MSHSQQSSVLSSQDPNVMRPASRLRPPSKLPMPGAAKRPLARLATENQAENVDSQAKKMRLDTAKPKPVAKKPTMTTVRRTGPVAGGTATTRPGSARPAAGKTTVTGPKPRPGTVSSTRPPAAKPAPKTATSRMGATTRPGVKPKATASQAPAAKKPASKPKRPAWDLKGRLADMEAAMETRTVANQDLEGRISENNGRIAYLEGLNQQLKGTVEIKETLSHQAEETIRTLQRKLKDAEEEFETVERRLKRERDDVKQDKDNLKRQLETVEGDYSASRQECAGLKSSIASLTAAQAGLNAELSATKLHLDQSTVAGMEKDANIASLQTELANLRALVEEKEAKIREHETTRRKLHNTIQELKGNIRVFCRVRPLLGEELVVGDDIPHIRFPDVDQKSLVLDRLSEISLNESTISTRNGRNAPSHYEFNFDRVFEPHSSQADVFEEISQLVQSVLDGYNVCIFAYGQTGSGKTYTMEGPEEVQVETEGRGMIPRAVEQVFVSQRSLEEKGWKYVLHASFLEIYNETIRDLLGAPNSKLKHEVRMVEAKSTEVEVSNINIIEVTSENEVHKLLSKASQNRAVAATNCNERSSRSHSVFRLKLSGSNSLTGESCTGTLNLVDLAGSERLSSSGSKGDRLKETQSINKSLSNLGNVILALANGDAHIPYRNSKLTHVLQNSLGGNSKTLMFVNISPKEENFQETLCSLRFATKVNQCNIGTAQKKAK